MHRECRDDGSVGCGGIRGWSIVMTNSKPTGNRFRRYDGRPSDEEQLGTKLGKTYNPPTLGDSLDRLVRNLGAPPISILSQLADRWPDVVGPALSSTTRPVELVNGVLTIACDDAAWAAQVGWMEAQIKQRFDDVFGPGQLLRLSVRTDR
jgi:hypothetical protein